MAVVISATALCDEGLDGLAIVDCGESVRQTEVLATDG